MSSGLSEELAAALREAEVLAIAGERFFERGRAYAAAGRVASIEAGERRIAARVRGTDEYRVELRLAADGDLVFGCDCPMGAEGHFCKHCVAVALAATGQAGNDGSPAAPARSAPAARARPRSGDVLREYLERQDRAALVALLLERAEADDQLRDLLLMRAARERQGGPDVGALRAAIDRAVRNQGFVDYAEAGDYAAGISSAVDEIEALLKEGHGGAVVDLAEHALRRVEAALGSVDDSDGMMGDLLGRLQEIHLRGCVAARPDPVALARRLFEWEMKGDYEVFLGAAETYADLLGSSGLGEYRRLAEAEWARVPAIAPRQREDGYGSRFRITSMMEAIARADGDLEALVAVMSRNLSHAYAFLRIAEECRAFGKPGLALEWAERGLEEFGPDADTRLIEFIANEYHRRGRHADAMALIWGEFDRRPRLESYQSLKTHARIAGAWPEWRERAVERLRARIAAERAQGRPATGFGAADASELVRVFLWEKKVDDAWAEAQSGGCSEELWFELARAREKEHPAEVIPIYRRRIDATIGRGNNKAYEEGVRLIRRLRELCDRAEAAETFGTFLRITRDTHRRKRNFMAMLEKAGFGRTGAGQA